MNQLLDPLMAISPVDGRYYSKLSPLGGYFSEFALIRYRVRVEMEYLVFLADKGFFELSQNERETALNIATQLTLEKARVIKDLEKKTNHDVKAVEYFIKQQLESHGLGRVKEWVHFGLTSQDINNTAIPMLWKDSMKDIFLPTLQNVLSVMLAQAEKWKGIPMLARTHGQPASPTTLGKEWLVFCGRLQGQLNLLSQIPYSAKFGGATGNFNAHKVAFPKHDWVSLSNEFVKERLGLERIQFTTQIEPYDNLAAYCDNLKRINNILIDFCRDCWSYISMDYFKQALLANEVGSSAMPHKVNPIDFENAEGNLGIANALYEHFAAKLPISRLQRDLTDSTVLRNLGVPVAHSLLALQSLEKGLGKLILNKEKLDWELGQNWAVVAEAIQTILRRENYPNPYEALKELTRGKHNIGQQEFYDFIEGLDIGEEVKAELRGITPFNYVGVF